MHKQYDFLIYIFFPIDDIDSCYSNTKLNFLQT